MREVDHINAYLRPSARNTIVYARSSPLAESLPKMTQGNRPNDGGNLILSQEEAESLIASIPEARVFIKRYVGSREFLNGGERFCLWIPDEAATDIAALPQISERLRKVRQARLDGGESAAAVADLPYRFDYRVHRDGHSIIVPSVSSERREYIPVGFLDGKTVISNLAYAIYGAEPWIFALISSRMHNAWVRAVAGRMKTDIRYSGKLCYNTFPVPPLPEKQREFLAERAFAVLEAREHHSDKSLAQLYDPEKMPGELREAHQFLDAAVDQLYRKRPFQSDDERLELLFDMYEGDHQAAAKVESEGQ